MAPLIYPLDREKTRKMKLKDVINASLEFAVGDKWTIGNPLIIYPPESNGYVP